ncbi:MAG TPA: RNA polymerase sigma factor [Ktedonosporobacter sp.]|nr:RNA polymerase sigma factor [Ktedonosporobacter sp.]
MNLADTYTFATLSKDTPGSLEPMLADERTRLVRFCAHISGNLDAAEDLAQETLLEAWRNQHKLADQGQAESRVKWLLAIARNVCLRWARSHGRDLAHLAPLKQYAEETEETIEDIPANNCDIEIELERDELTQLLDRALALLPPATREVLIARYIHESSHADIIQRLGLSEDTLVQRLHRGKLALRRVITTHMPEEAAAYGLTVPAVEQLQQETRIWCPFCGTGRLIKYNDPPTQTTRFACSDCGQVSLYYSEACSGLTSPRPILSRHLALLGNYYWQAINAGQITCPHCGNTAQAVPCNAEDIPSDYPHSCGQGFYGIYIACPNCSMQEVNPLPHLTLDTPEGRLFWQKHPRMRWLPGHEIEHSGQPAIIGSFQSLSASTQIDIIYHRETLKILNIHEHNT